ncbi:MAG TPA: helical backbone metal receptor [Gemmatimonadales bacterium]|nr:helical backbone metal receptor [Gemmatimonadales bacterium]
MRRWAHRTHLAGLLVFAASACGTEGKRPAPAGAVTVTDDLGRVVTLATPAHRIVSLSPAATELVFALGAGARLVGRTTWCDYPPAALAVPSVGDGLSPNIEAVVARRPDLVLVYRSPLDQAATAQLAGLGIPAVVLEQDRLEQVGRAARVVGVLAGRERAGDSLAAALAALVARPLPPARVRVAFVVWDTPPVVIGGGSYLDQLATLAGATNVFHDVGAASASVGLETIATRDPDVIAVPRDTARGEVIPPAFIRRPEWQAIRAIRARRLVYLRGSIFSWPGPRAEQAADQLRQLLAEAGR